MRFWIGAVVAVAASLAPAPARAITVTHNWSFADSIHLYVYVDETTDRWDFDSFLWWGSVQGVPSFDPAQGVLTQVDVTMTVSGQARERGEWAEGFNVGGHGIAGLSDPVTWLYGEVFWDHWVNGTWDWQWRPFGESTSFQTTTPSEILSYQGSGDLPIGFDYSAYLDSGWWLPEPLEQACYAEADMEFTAAYSITYTYDPLAEDEPPVADPNGPYVIAIGDGVTLDGSGSTDPDGNIVNYLWSVGALSHDAGAAAICPLTWDDLTGDLGINGTGVYTLTLTVTDDQDLTHSASTTLTVVPEPATLSLLALGGLGLLARRRRRR